MGVRGGGGGKDTFIIPVIADVEDNDDGPDDEELL